MPLPSLRCVCFLRVACEPWVACPPSQPVNVAKDAAQVLSVLCGGVRPMVSLYGGSQCVLGLGVSCQVLPPPVLTDAKADGVGRLPQGAGPDVTLYQSIRGRRQAADSLC